jgi:predicted dehydrogenase
MAQEGVLGAAVVGTGFGVLTHVRALRAAGHEVRALVGRDPEKTKSRADRCGIPMACTSLGDALAGADVDIVTVATPPHTHGPLVLEAVGSGRHVMCEKPFARDASEAEEMRAAADEAGVVGLLGAEFRFAAGQAQLKRVVDAGMIGEPTLALFLLHIPTHADPSAELPGWWQDAGQGGGWLGAHGSHIVDQVMSTLGPFASVNASLQTIAPRAMSADDTYSVQFELVGGATGIMHSSCASAGQFVATTKISGTKGSAWLQGDEVWVDDLTGGARPIPPDHDLVAPPPSPPPAEFLHTAYDMWHSMGIDLAPFTRLYDVMGALIQGRTFPADPQPATFADAVAGQRVLDAIRRSSAARERVAL